MQPSVKPDERLVAVAREVEALERACADAERAMLERDWERLAAVLNEARRLQHALQNALEAAGPVRTPSFDAQLETRLHWIHGVRANQIARMQHYRDAVKERLAGIARLKTVARSIGKPQSAPRLAALDHLT